LARYQAAAVLPSLRSQPARVENFGAAWGRGRRAVAGHGREAGAGSMGETRGENAVTGLRADLDEQRRRVAELEGQLRDREAERDAAVRELDVLCYAISHDLRAPLRAVDGFSEALAEDCAEQVGDEGRGYIRRVRTAAARMVAMIDAILELSRLARAQMERSEVDVSELAGVVAGEVEKRYPDRSVNLIVQPGVIALADQPQLRLLLETLVDNAWKFTGKRAEACVEIGFREGGEPEYCVRDDGAGFDMAFAGKLFAPFQRLHAPSDFEGLGVGLARAKRIVQRHGGRIRIEATVDGGATVYFSLGQRPGAQASRVGTETGGVE